MEKSNLNNQNTQKKKNIWPKLITLLFIALIAAIAVSLLPRGFSNDTSQVGQGSNVLLLVHDDDILQSIETMAVMNDIRDEYAERLTFIVADTKTPEGKTFADRHNLQPPALVFFSATGEKLQTLYSSQTSETLRQELNNIFRYPI